MKKQIIYIHGGDSFSNREDFLLALATKSLRDLPGSETFVSWRSSLAEDLGEQFEVFMPKMPNKENAHYDEWKVWFERYLQLVSDGVVLIGHSLGGMFLAKYFSENDPKVKISKVYLLAAPGGDYKGEKEYGNCVDFMFSASQLQKMVENVAEVNVWHSKDDFVVAVSELEWYKKYLPEAKITLFKDKNHFLLAELPELLNELKQQ